MNINITLEMDGDELDVEDIFDTLQDHIFGVSSLGRALREWDGGEPTEEMDKEINRCREQIARSKKRLIDSLTIALKGTGICL